MKVIVKYKKINRLKYISHLDTIRLLQRAFRRGEINVLYSKGYNPHPRFSFAAPLSLGLETHGDYLEIELSDDENYETIITRLNKVLPKDFEILSIEKSKYDKTLASRLKGIIYKIKLEVKNVEKDKIEKIINSFFLEEQIVERIKNKRGRKKIKRFDCRRFIEKIEVIQEDKDIINLKVYSIFSNEGSVKMEELIQLLKKMSLEIKDYSISREDMIFEKNEEKRRKVKEK